MTTKQCWLRKRKVQSAEIATVLVSVNSSDKMEANNFSGLRASNTTRLAKSKTQVYTQSILWKKPQNHGERERRHPSAGSSKTPEHDEAAALSAVTRPRKSCSPASSNGSHKTHQNAEETVSPSARNRTRLLHPEPSPAEPGRTAALIVSVCISIDLCISGEPQPPRLVSSLFSFHRKFPELPCFFSLALLVFVLRTHQPSFGFLSEFPVAILRLESKRGSQNRRDVF